MLNYYYGSNGGTSGHLQITPNNNNQMEKTIMVEKLCKVLFKELGNAKHLTTASLVCDLVDRGKITPNQARFLLGLPMVEESNNYQEKEDIQLL